MKILQQVSINPTPILSCNNGVKLVWYIGYNKWINIGILLLKSTIHSLFLSFYLMYFFCSVIPSSLLSFSLSALGCISSLRILDINLFFGNIICKYFLPCSKLPFCFVYCYFHCAKAFDFDVVAIVNFSFCFPC